MEHRHARFLAAELVRQPALLRPLVEKLDESRRIVVSTSSSTATP
jgi:hypothetical protein